MPRTETIERTIYTFDELSDAAKERARDWYRGCIDESDFDCEIAEFVTIGEAIGIDFDTHEVTLMGGGKRRDPNVHWSLSYCQGDGASFEGQYTYRPDAVAKLRAINDDETSATSTTSCAPRTSISTRTRRSTRAFQCNDYEFDEEGGRI